MASQTIPMSVTVNPADPVTSIGSMATFGRFQKWQYVLATIPILFTAMSNINYVFSAAAEEARCLVPACESANSTPTTPPWWPAVEHRCSRPVLSSKVIGNCSVHSFANRSEACDKWVYGSRNSIVSEFDLACQEWKRTLVGTIHNVGVMISMPLMGFISDRWGRRKFGYFKALAENRPPPVKLRLEYPVYSTEGGLTRGCLKVIAHQLQTIGKNLPLYLIRKAWRGFCLDPNELRRIFCLCEVYTRQDYVPFLHFIAVAGGLLTKNLTYTMILLCEILTKEPDGGSGAIPVNDFLAMYLFLARMDASKDVRYVNGYREGRTPRPEEEEVEEEQTISEATVDAKLKQLSTSKVQLKMEDGMVAGRQMSITSGEFIVQHIEREIMDYIDDQIAILPDPDLKKKKAKPEEVEMISTLLYQFLDDNMEVIVPEVEVVEEEELPIPEIIVVYAVPGIGPPVPEQMVADIEDYANDVSKNQGDLVMPRNFRHFLSPPLERFEDYQDDHRKEELACSGVFTN